MRLHARLGLFSSLLNSWMYQVSLADPRGPDKLSYHMDAHVNSQSAVIRCWELYMCVYVRLCLCVPAGLILSVHVGPRVMRGQSLVWVRFSICGWKTNPVRSSLSVCSRKILTTCLRVSLLPEGVWAVVSSFWTAGALRQERQPESVCVWVCVSVARLIVCEQRMNVLWWLEFPLDEAHTVLRWMFFSSSCQPGLWAWKAAIEVKIWGPGFQTKRDYKGILIPYRFVSHWHFWLWHFCPSMPTLWAATHPDTPAWVRARVAAYMWVCTSLFTGARFKCLSASLSPFWYLPSLSLPPPALSSLLSSSPSPHECKETLWEEISAPVLSVWVLTAPSYCCTQLSGYRQQMEHSTNCAGHRGHAASPSLSTQFASPSPPAPPPSLYCGLLSTLLSLTL